VKKLGNLEVDGVIYGTLILSVLGVNDRDLEVMQTRCPTFSMDCIVVSIYNSSCLIYLCFVNFTVKCLYT
jgi:hypothetical protein